MTTEEDRSAATVLTPPYTFGVPWPDFNDGLAYSDVVKPSHSDTTLIGFYSTKYRNSAPLQGWIQRIQNGQITVDGEVMTDPDSELRVGSKLTYFRRPWEEPYAPYLIEVLYEDEDMVAISKPSGLQVLPGGLFQQRTLLTQLRWQYQSQSSPSQLSKSSVKRSPAPVHRLGRGTSGILLCAMTKLAKARLAAYFADGTSAVRDNWKSEKEHDTTRRILKLYRALVTGVIDTNEVVIKHPIGVIHYPGVASGLYVASSSGKPALSKVLVLERDVQKNQSLVQVEIHSGRPHQIRIHLAFIGHPLVGDPLYGIGGQPNYFQPIPEDGDFAEDGGYHRPVNPVPGDCGYHLHAHRLVVCHPSTNKTVDIIAPLPPMLRTLEESGGGTS